MIKHFPMLCTKLFRKRMHVKQRVLKPYHPFLLRSRSWASRPAATRWCLPLLPACTLLAQALHPEKHPYIIFQHTGFHVRLYTKVSFMLSDGFAQLRCLEHAGKIKSRFKSIQVSKYWVCCNKLILKESYFH